jgi:DNA polymerase-3 subunit epsilon
MLARLLNITRPLIVLDLETTGVDPEVDHICQIGFRVHRPDTTQVDEYVSLVDPLMPIPAESTEAHGITDEMIATCCAKCKRPRDLHPFENCSFPKPVPRFLDLAESLYRGFTGADFAGYSVRFDVRCVIAEMFRCNLHLDVSTTAVIDSLRAWQHLEPRTLGDAVERFTGQRHVDAHDAMADVIGAENTLIGQLTNHPRSTDLPRDPQALHTLLWPNNIDIEGKFVFNRRGVACINFGKHKGQPMADCISYLHWMARSSFSPATQRIVKDALAGRFPTKAT